MRKSNSHARFSRAFYIVGYLLVACGSPFWLNVTPAFQDRTYLAAGSDWPSARLISNLLFHDNDAKLHKQSNKTALFAFFSELVNNEILDSDDSSCPTEVLKIPVPSGDPDFDPDKTGSRSMPYERKLYDRETGLSPNAPRNQVNGATSFIDASFVYGSSEVWAGVIRDAESGQLTSNKTLHKQFPSLNDIRLPFDNLPHMDSMAYLNPEIFWRLGHPHVQENPGVLALAVILYRWHNVKAVELQSMHGGWSHTKVFHTARKWVIASLQKIIFDEWLPTLLPNVAIPPYTGYRKSQFPSASALFSATASNFYLTHIPSAITYRDKSCDHVSLADPASTRLCNAFWKSQEILLTSEETLDQLILGMSTQAAEPDDMAVVDDCRNKYYGPLHYSRHDAVALTIMLGRDYGLPDYNTVRREMGLKEMSWTDLMASLSVETRERVQSLYNGSLSRMDAFVGGMLETQSDGPGELFSAIILDQFIRLRDGDRFWFQNSMFTSDELKEINKITLSHIIQRTTTLTNTHLQHRIFYTDGASCPISDVNKSSLHACPDHTGFDYFAGSEIPYIIVWVCFGLLPFVCIALAYIWYLCRKRIFSRQEHQKYKTMVSEITASSSRSISNTAFEWVGQKHSMRQVQLKILEDKGYLMLHTPHGSRLRTITFQHMDSIDMFLSTDKGQTVLMIRIPQEYDLVLVFPSSSARDIFEKTLCQMLKLHDRDLKSQKCLVYDIHETTITKEKRNQKLEKFFKTVFAQAYKMDYDPTQDETSLPVSNDVLEFILTKDEFAEALSDRSDSDFVSRMFQLLDADHDGYISFREFLNTVILFTKGSSKDKLNILYGMYLNKGVMDRSCLKTMIQSLLDIVQSDANVNTIVDQLCSGHPACDTTLSFNEFCAIFLPEFEKISNVTLEWKGAHAHVNKSGVTSTKRKPVNELRAQHKLLAVHERFSPLKARLKDIKHFMENNHQHIFYLILFFGIVAGLFAERFYTYSVEREHSGLRQITGYGLSFSRGGAAGMSFTFSLLLLTMCRNTITWLRETCINQYVPFDSAIAFHKVVAWAALLFTGVHVFGYCFNLYQLITQPTAYLCIFNSIVFRSDLQFKFDFWAFGNVIGFTGVLLALIICVIYVFAVPIARRYIFSAFWMTHKLFILMYILTLIHGSFVVVQYPLFYIYFTGPAIWYTLDKLVSLTRRKVEISVVRAENLPSDVTMLELKRPSQFEYKSGQWVRLACSAQGKNEFHPFTLTSAPHEDTVMLHIRAVGPWTWNLRSNFDNERLRSAPYPKLYLDGPYGAGQQDWCRYDVSVLIGAGIGVTPYASILKDFVYMASSKNTFRLKCQKLYFIWVTGSHRHFEWMLDILRQVEEVDQNGIVDTHIFITQFFQRFDLRTTLLYMCEDQKPLGDRSIFTGLKAATHFGRPQFTEILQGVYRDNPHVRRVGVFSCGPSGITSSVAGACGAASSSTKALFTHHCEKF